MHTTRCYLSAATNVHDGRHAVRYAHPHGAQTWQLWSRSSPEREDRLTSSIWEIFPCFRYSSRLCIRPGVYRQLSEAENCDGRAAILYTVTEVCICVWVFCEQERKQRAHALTFCTSHLHTEMEAR